MNKIALGDCLAYLDKAIKKVDDHYAKRIDNYPTDDFQAFNRLEAQALEKIKILETAKNIVSCFT